MNLFLDCEFNGFCGELLSMALVSESPFTETRDVFYLIVSDTKETPTEWVSEHVIPNLDKYAGFGERATRNEMRRHLQHFLCRFGRVHIIADWPEDIVHFCKLLLTNIPGERISTPPLTMEIVRFDSPSVMPHNALADAFGIRDEYLRRNLIG